MKLIEYLKSRNKRALALTRSEASIIHINYPLQSGWIKSFGDTDIPDELIKKMRTARKNRYKKKSYKKAKARSVYKSSKAGSDRKKLETLVKAIISQGCKDEKRMAEHLLKPSTNSTR